MLINKNLLESLFKTNDRVEAVVSIDVIGSVKDTNTGNPQDFRKAVPAKSIMISKCNGGNVVEPVDNDPVNVQDPGVNSLPKSE